jgi:pimeloyl-ACP methyl ester carboxylesterase
MLTFAASRATLVLSRIKFGGKTFMTKRSDGPDIPTQLFNASGRRNDHANLAADIAPDIAVVFLPGFATLPLLVPPGVVGAACKAEGVDFVRYNHPHMLTNRAALRFNTMVGESISVCAALPHRHLILAATSFGAGELRFVTEEMEHLQPDRIRGIFSWMSVTPEALVDLFQRQEGWTAFNQPGHKGRLRVDSPSLADPLFLSHAQCQGISLHAHMTSAPYISGPAHFIYGEQDKVGPARFTHELARKMGIPATQLEITGVPSTNRLDPSQIQAGLQKLIRRVKQNLEIPTA